MFPSKVSKKRDARDLREVECFQQPSEADFMALAEILEFHQIGLPCVHPGRVQNVLLGFFPLAFVFVLFFKFTYLFHIPVGVSPPPPLPHPHTNSCSHLPIHCPPSLFRKRQVSPEDQQNMAYRVTGRLSTSSCFKAGQGRPVRGVGSQKPVNKSEKTPNFHY